MQYLTIAQVMEILQVSRSTVDRMIDSGKIEHFKIGSAVRVPKESLDKYIQEKRNESKFS